MLQDLLSKDIHLDTSKWLAAIGQIREEYPIQFDDCPGLSGVNPKKLFDWLSGQVPENTTLVADVGLNQIWAALYFQITRNRRFYTSGGLGTMAYSVPAAAGAAFATRERPKTIISVCGDGSFQMGLGELGVIAEHKLPLKIIMLNNHKLGMVRQQQHDNYGKNHYSGTDINFNVDFMQLVKAYDIKGYHAETNEEAEAAILESLAQPGPTLVECMVDEDFIRI